MSEVRWVSDYWGIVEFMFPEPPWFDAMTVNFDDDDQEEEVTLFHHTLSPSRP